MSRERLFAAFFFVAFLFLLYQSYRVFSTFAAPLSWGALLAFMFHPLYRRLLALLRQREGLAAFLLTTLVILIVIVPTLYLSLVLASESVSFVRRANDAAESGRLTALAEQWRAGALGHFWDRVAPHVDAWKIDPRSLLLKGGESVSTFFVSQATALATNVVHFVTDLFFTAFALFFFFRDGERMVLAFHRFIPMKPDDKDAILARFNETLSAVVQGTLVTAIVQGALSALGFWILSVPFAILLGAASALLSLIPFGAPVMWMAVVTWLMINGDWIRALILAIWGTAVVGTADNVIRPLIIGGRTKIPTVYLFFGILGGLNAYGFLGVFLGPVLIAILVAFLRIYREQYALD